MHNHLGLYSRGYLPHADLPGTIQHIRFHIAGALPAHVLAWIQSQPKKERDELSDESLDQTPSNSPLLPYEADVVESSLLFFDGFRYDLFAWVVMPNHVHVCFLRKDGWPLGKLIHSWKRHSAREINRARGRSGQAWARDFFDKAVRTEKQLRNTIAYIEGNPVKAGLVAAPSDWRWSSAWNNRTRWASFGV